MAGSARTRSPAPPATLTSPNYSFQTGSTANFAISRRALSVNADAKTKTYGAADPTFTYGFSGFARARTPAT